MDNWIYRIERNIRWKSSKSVAPPLQPKRLGRIGSFFGTRPLMWILSGAPRRFLNFILKPEIWAHLGVFEGSDWGSKIDSFWLISRLQEWNSKIASVPLKAFTWGGSRQKMNKFGQGVWAVGGGATGFGGFSPCISITSVLRPWAQMNTWPLRHEEWLPSAASHRQFC